MSDTDNKSSVGKIKGILQVIIAALIIVVAAFAVYLLLGPGKTKNPEKAEVSPIKVGMVLTGSATDGGWNEMNYQGLKTACRKYGVKLLASENVPENTVICDKAIRGLASAGCNIIFLTSYGYAEAADNPSSRYPGVKFFVCANDFDEEGMNSYTGRMYQARFLTGIIAGMTTKSNIIGYVAAMPNNEVNRGINAFTLGARSVNPDVSVHVEWVGSWNDSEKEKAAAHDLIDKGADVLTYHANVPNTIQVADEEGVYSIGYHRLPAEHSDKCLTAAVNNWDVIYDEMLSDYLKKTDKDEDYYWQGIETGAVGLDEYSPLVSEDIKQKVEEAKARIIDGNDVFSGNIKDNEGNIRCEEGEFLSDMELLGSMDWYVEGVVLHEEVEY